MNMAKDDFAVDRHRFVLVVWLPDRVPILRKALVSVRCAAEACAPRQATCRASCFQVHTGIVKEQIRNMSVEIAASSIQDLNEADIQIQLKKASGANYDR